jgi:hypothetical protein
MDFKSLPIGANFYVLREGGERPTLSIGTVKTRTEPKPQYQTQTPAIYTGMQIPLVVDITANVAGEEIPFGNLPANSETSTYQNGSVTVCCTTESILQAVSAMMDKSRKRIELRKYDDAVMEAGEEFTETLNPQYKESKAQKREIADLKERVGGIYDTMNQMMSMMQSLQKGVVKGTK